MIKCENDNQLVLKTLKLAYILELGRKLNKKYEI